MNSDQRFVDDRLSEEQTREIETFISTMRSLYGENWGFVLDFKDNIAQVLRCTYSDTGSSGMLPVLNVPFIADFSWRVTAMEKENPLYFKEIDPRDPRSFYLRKTLGTQQLALFQIKTDSNIGLLSMFTVRETSRVLSSDELQAIFKRCQSLRPLLEQVVWQREQEILDQATRAVREREIPEFICQLFGRMLESATVFLEKVDGNSFRSLCHFGIPDATKELRFLFELPSPEGKVFHQLNWAEICISSDIYGDAAVTAIYLKPREHVLLVLGELRLQGLDRDELFHYLQQVERLLTQPAFHISTLTFLHHLQHWIGSAERDIKSVFQHIIDALVPFLNADFGTLTLLDPRKEKILFVSQAGKISNPLDVLPIENERGEPTSILAFVARENRPYLASDVSKDPYYQSFNPSIKSEICVPIRVRGEMIGLFSASSKRVNQFQERDITKLQFFSDQIGIALFQAGILDSALLENESARRLDQEIKFGFHVQTHAKDLTYNFGNLIGNPKGAMREVFEAIRKINDSGRDDLNVLITGETGCGKEMVAFALHHSGHRGSRSMVIANFASFGGDPNLIQSELFGHEKGSFSGATQRRIGCIELANDSTLLIDEVGDIVSSVQIKLLRVLQQGAIKAFQRLGGQENIKSNVRILAATHKDLVREVRDSRFREDLFYRLHTLVIRIPPLRERLEDIALLLPHFAARYEREIENLKIRWTEDAVPALQSYFWPGNVRQLEAVLNRALVMYADDGLLTGEVIKKSLAAESHHQRVEGTLFERVCEAGQSAFWGLVHQPYRNHELTHTDLLGCVTAALTTAKGSYKQAAAMMGVDAKDYNRFLDFLKNSNAKPDYRDFRR